MLQGRVKKLKPGMKPLLVAVVGGSGSGKSRLAGMIKSRLGPKAMCLSLDAFYRDRSRLSPARRAQLNFDNPRSIDWPLFENAVRDLLAGKTARLPCYDFSTHCRSGFKSIKPRRFILVDGLWLLRRPGLRRNFALRVFLDCPGTLRLKRRLKRDARERGRTIASVRAQFRATVEPMHARFVVPQRRWANVIMSGSFRPGEVDKLVSLLCAKANEQDGLVLAD